ncbi:hypothetical protein GCM10022221_67520 [Actinocorallia aurea]
MSIGAVEPDPAGSQHAGVCMHLYRGSNGVQLKKTDVTVVTDPVVDTDPLLKVVEDVWVEEFWDGTGPKFPETRRSLMFAKNTYIRTSAWDAAFPAAEILSITPATAVVAGGGTFTVRGKRFTKGMTINVGGTNATGVTVVGTEEATATFPAHAAGAVAVVVTTDAGAVTKNAAVTYA